MGYHPSRPGQAHCSHSKYNTLVVLLFTQVINELQGYRPFAEHSHMTLSIIKISKCDVISKVANCKT